MKSSKKEAPKRDASLHVPQHAKIDKPLEIQVRVPWTEKQKLFIETASQKETKVMLVKGCAGTAKTYLSVYVSLLEMNARKKGEIIYVRNPVESSHYSMGFLPGTLEEKFGPYQQPLVDKLQEFVSKASIDVLVKGSHLRSIPVGHLRGLSLNGCCVIADEAQNFSIEDLLLIMSRMGRFSKLFLIGDIQQSDVRNSGFERVFDSFDTLLAKNKGFHTFEFNKQDIVREETLSFVIETFEQLRASMKASNGNAR